MSFRARLGLFFVLIVVIPMVAIAALVVDVTGDARSGKADARLATGLQAALSLYEENAAEARAQVSELLADEEVRSAIDSGEPRRIRAALRGPARSRGIERLVVRAPDGSEIDVVASGDELATAVVRATGAAGEFQLRASVTGPTEYVEDVANLTGLDAAVVDGAGVSASTRAVPGDLPVAGEAGDVEAGARTLRAAAGALPEGESLRVLVFTEAEEGGFLSSRPRIAALVVGFLALAGLAVFLVMRTLQSQIAAMLAAARRLGAGDFSGRVPVVGRDEMAGLANEFNLMSDRLQAQIDQLRRQRTELDRAVRRMADAIAAGLDREALLKIVADTALGGCDAQYCRIALGDGAVIEVSGGAAADLGEVAAEAEDRASSAGALVAAERSGGHALAAPLRDPEAAGTLLVAREGRPFDDSEREIFEYLLEQASSSIENISAHELVSEQAVTDELTGLPNNRAFRETIDREAQRAERFGHELSLIILDVDDFKRINDTYGHLQGDEVLRVIGRILSTEPRAIDEPARYGGEEFVVALPETGTDGAVELAERVRARLAEVEIDSVEGGEPLRVTASFGVATMPGAASDAQELVAAADAALYEAKRSGKNRVVTAPDAVRSQR